MTAYTPTSTSSSPLAAARAVRAAAAVTGGTGTQFDLLYNALIANNPDFARDKGTFFQFATSPEAATWVTTDDGIAFHVADAVSANLDHFYTPAGSFSTAYASCYARADHDETAPRFRRRRDGIKTCRTAGQVVATANANSCLPGTSGRSRTSVLGCTIRSAGRDNDRKSIA